MRHVGGGTPHVESDLAIETGGARSLDHADNPASRSAQERVLALEVVGFGQSSVGLHKHKERVVVL